MHHLISASSTILSSLTILATLLFSMGLLACGSGDSGEQQQTAENGPVVTESGELQQARAAANKLGMALKQELSAAMQDGGPEAAMQVCNTRAAEVTEALCSESGLNVARVSSRWRNPGNAPDAVEAAVLARFESDPGLADTLLALPEGGILYMKPIRVQSPLCLQCHGSEDALAEGVPERLAVLYPDDHATGFSEGDLRGAFTVRFPTTER